MNHVYYMEKAYELAVSAGKSGDIPVGCVIVLKDRIIASGYNRRESEQSAICHAELTAIKNACESLGYWRLDGASIYVTLEPCIMCAGAIINSRIAKVIFGLSDTKAGAFGGRFDSSEFDLPHKPEIISGIFGEKIKPLMDSFFDTLRK